MTVSLQIMLLLLLAIPVALADVRPIDRNRIDRLMHSINARTRQLGAPYSDYR